jgi:hypothetical protein
LTTIDSIAAGGISRAAGKSRRVAAGGAFRVDDTAADQTFPGDAASGAGLVGTVPAGTTMLDSLLATQESASAKAADAAAIQQGCSVLDLLTQLQRAALAGHGPGDRGRGSPGRSIGDAAGEITGALGRHVGLMEAMAAPADPRLRGLMAAIRLRGQIELVRRTRAGS